MLFHQIEDCFVVLRCKGVFRQAKVFRRGKHVYAAAGAGFLRLLNRGATTRPETTWEDLTASPEIRMLNNGCPEASSPAPIVAIASPGALAA